MFCKFKFWFQLEELERAFERAPYPDVFASKTFLFALPSLVSTLLSKSVGRQSFKLAQLWGFAKIVVFLNSLSKERSWPANSSWVKLGSRSRLKVKLHIYILQPNYFQHPFFHPTFLKKTKIGVTLCVSGLVSEPESKVAEEGTPKEDWRALFWHIMSAFTPFHLTMAVSDSISMLPNSGCIIWVSKLYSLIIPHIIPHGAPPQCIPAPVASSLPPPFHHLPRFLLSRGLRWDLLPSFKSLTTCDTSSHLDTFDRLALILAHLAGTHLMIPLPILRWTRFSIS